MRSDGSRARSVLMVVEQLRRRVPGGSGTYAVGVLSGLEKMQAAGKHVPAVTLLASRARADGAGHGREDPLVRFGMPLLSSRLPGPLLTRAWEANLIRAPAGFEVLHGTSLAIPQSKGARTIVTVHDLAWRHVPFAYPKRGREWHERSFLRSVNRGHQFVVPSAPVADEVRAAGAEPSKVVVIEPGCDHLPEPDEPAAAAMLGRAGVSGPYILSVATLEPRKNLGALIDAFSDVRGSLPGDWSLVIVGPKGWGPELVPRDGVAFLGPVVPGELSGLYVKAEMLAYVPLVEGYGLPPLEAMRAGTPVVSSPVPSVAGAALEVDPNSRDRISEGLVAVATDESLRQSLVERGQARSATVTWERCASLHVSLWQSDVRV
jgi:glycosyltransferase involved in cell wall biosynthesis